MGIVRRSIAAFIAYTICIVIPLNCLANELEQEKSQQLLDAVTVQGSNVSIPASQSELIRISKVFERMKPRVSPNGLLKFKITPAGGKLVLSNNDHSVDVPYDKRGVFDLAQLPFLDNSSFYSETRKSKIRPVVQSDADDNTARIGDVRLECELMWEMIKSDAPIKVRMYLSANGGWCGSKKISWMYGIGKIIVSAKIVDGNRVYEAKVSSNRMEAVVPIQDKNFSNDAVLTITTD